MTVRALVFDVDGVLVRAGVFADILDRQYGLSREATSGFFHGPFKECVLGRADLKEAIAPFLREWAWAGTVEDCLRLWFEADSAVNEGVLGLVPHLRAKGLPCYVASTQESNRAAYLEDVLGFRQMFDELFFSCRVGASKPDRAFFDHVAGRVGAAGHEILLIDDHEANVAGARAAGWHGELYAWGDNMEDLLDRYDIRWPLRGTRGQP